jgi:FAD/FMN-containing dehydrogenase
VSPAPTGPESAASAALEGWYAAWNAHDVEGISALMTDDVRYDDPEPKEHWAWARSAWEAIRPYSTGGNYINAQTADEDETRLNAAYRDSLGRLAQVKASYDPDNLFRVNRNIAPARGAASSAEVRARQRSAVDPQFR